MAPSLGIRHPDKGRYFIQCVGASKTRILTQGTHQNKENKKNVSELYKQFLFGDFMVQGKQLSKALDAFTLVLS